MLRTNSNYSITHDRYLYQGQEMDDEVKGEGNSVNYKYRMHDPRLGRFFAIDPLASMYPHNSPYSFSENVVIDHIELEGLEKARPEEIKWAVLNPVDALYIAGSNGQGGNRELAQNTAQDLESRGKLKFLGDGSADAFRHAYWNALNTADIGSTEAADFATLHELGETNPAKDPKNELYDPISIQMDLHNNYKGRQIANENPDASDAELKTLVLKAVYNGDLLKIKMNSNGEWLDKNGNITKDVREKVLVTTKGENYNGKLLGQNNYVPDLTPKGTKGTQTLLYQGDGGNYEKISDAEQIGVD